MIGNVCLRPVGTRGGRGAGWGPCACPRGMTSDLGSARPPGLIPTRTSTRPPHPPTAPLVPTGCRTHLPRFGRHHSSGGGAASVPMGMITPFSWQNSLGLDLAGDEELSRSFEPCLNNQHRSCHPERSEGSAQRSISVPSETDPSLRSG